MPRFFEIVIDKKTVGPKAFPFPLLVGGEEACTVRLPGTDRTLFLIGEKRGHLYLQPVSQGEAIFHNGQKVTSSVWIKSGDITRIDNYVITYFVSRDLVTIEATPINKLPRNRAKKVLATQDQGAEKHKGKKLPEVDKGQRKAAAPIWKKILTCLSLFLLLAVALFLLSADSINITVSPKPDVARLKGSFPVFEFRGRYLAIPGTYEFHAEKKGYRPVSKKISVGKGQGTYHFTLSPLPGIVKIASSPPGADVTIDSKHAGKTPLINVEVESGNHTLVLDLDGYNTLRKNVHVQGMGERQTFSFSLNPKPFKDKTRASLKPVTAKKSATAVIDSIPHKAGVRLDGVYAGKTPLTIGLSSNTTHAITISVPGYQRIETKVKLGPGEKKRFSYRLKPQFATLFVTSYPENLRLYIDGRLQKKNIGPFTLLARKHTILAKVKGFEEKRLNINLLPGEKRIVNFRLKEKPGPKNNSKKTSTRKISGMVLVHPHAFLMGSSRREQGRRTNEVQRKVVLKRSFYIGLKEVTNDEFRKFRPGHSSGSVSTYSLNGNSQPAVNVSWDDAARYCNWLSEESGLPAFYVEKAGRMVPVSPANTGFRLPTEAEWAFVARVFMRRNIERFPWGQDFPPRRTTGNYADESARDLLPVIITNYNDSFPVTAPVGSFAPGPGGLFDIGGNVAEWCNDIYSPLGSPQKIDPLGPRTGTHHVVRGASWRDATITRLRLSYRGYSRKGTDYIGFRVARYATSN